MDKVNQKLPTIQILKFARLVMISGNNKSICSPFTVNGATHVTCVNMLEYAAVLIRRLKIIHA
jgi:hypothetical protein